MTNVIQSSYMRKKDHVLTVRLRKEEYDALKGMAAGPGLSVGEYVRRILSQGLSLPGTASPGVAVEEMTIEHPPELRGVITKIDTKTKTATVKPIFPATCDHAGTEILPKSGMGDCPKCGKTVTAKDLK